MINNDINEIEDKININNKNFESIKKSIIGGDNFLNSEKTITNEKEIIPSNSEQ